MPEARLRDALDQLDPGAAAEVLGDETLRDIARELVEKVRAKVSID